MEIKQLTIEEINFLKQIQEKRIELIEKFGTIEFQYQELLLLKETLIKELAQLKESETKIGTELQQKYGNGSINISKGEIILS